ncbi:glycosyltransferase family 4 protein [Methylocella sp. CPCC 101449]|uniref:glycosyltransferase family 4 protein n=1 Tax=Methylocella sp. CPCC 101449 TaxID=2987531 RepID=UPI00288C6850|nr:glycosyltransferase family 4 protein [Methylocella sp. CPCC 101449]MDT2019452.1 glycosyltransferase family 4 protein [Methylocella sp. CPCC 101449]
MVHHMANLCVGYQRDDYPERRNITNLAFPGIKHQLAPDSNADVPSEFLDFVNSKGWASRYVASPAPNHNIDLYHYFNSIPVSDVKFISTFESSLPRWWGASQQIWQRGFDILAGPNCRALIAMSQNAALIQEELYKMFPDISDKQAIQKKIYIVHPPQEIDYKRHKFAKFEHPKVQITFIGRDFLRKGGYEFIKSVDKLNKKNIKFDATIVSPLITFNNDSRWNDKAEEKLNETKVLINSLDIEYFPSLNNEAVLDLLSRSHAYVLPSFHDTYGFSVIEAQSVGCPVVCTDQRSFPELNSNDIGWILPTEKDSCGQINSKDEAAFLRNSDMLVQSLTEKIAEIVQHPEIVKLKAIQSIERIKKEHDPYQYSLKIAELYRKGS